MSQLIEICFRCCFIALFISLIKSEMDSTICEMCKVHNVEWCCICHYPLPSYCSMCFFRHHQESKGDHDFALHCKLPLQAKNSIDSGDKQRQLRDILLDLAEPRRSATEVANRCMNVKEQFGKLVNDVIDRIQNQQREEIAEKLDKISNKADYCIDTAIANIASDLSTASEELAAVSAFLAESSSTLEEAESLSRAYSVEQAMKGLWLSLPAICEKRTKVELVLCLPSNRALGVYQFTEEMLVQEVVNKVKEMLIFPQFHLFFGSTALAPDLPLRSYDLPKLALVCVSPFITLRSDEGLSNIYVNDTETVQELKSRLTAHSLPLTEHHHIVCSDTVLDDLFSLLHTGEACVFDLITSKQPWDAVLIREESFAIIELPILSLEEGVADLKTRIARKIRYDEDCLRLSFHSFELVDTSKLSEMGVQPGSVLSLELLTRVYVRIPAISTPLCIVEPNQAATAGVTKLEIANRLNLPTDNQVLLYQGRELESDYSLSAAYRSSVEVTLQIKGFLLASYKDNEYMTVLFVDGEERVGDLRSRIADLLQAEAALLVVVYKGNSLALSTTLASEGITEGCLVTLLQRNMQGDLGEEVKGFTPRCSNPTGADEADDEIGFTRVTVKSQDYGNLVLEHLQRSTQVITLKETVRVRLEVPVACQEFSCCGTVVQDKDSLWDFTTQGEEGIVFFLLVRVVA